MTPEQIKEYANRTGSYCDKAGLSCVKVNKPVIESLTPKVQSLSFSTPISPPVKIQSCTTARDFVAKVSDIVGNQFEKGFGNFNCWGHVAKVFRWNVPFAFFFKNLKLNWNCHHRSFIEKIRGVNENIRAGPRKIQWSCDDAIFDAMYKWALKSNPISFIGVDTGKGTPIRKGCHDIDYKEKGRTLEVCFCDGPLCNRSPQQSQISLAALAASTLVPLMYSWLK